MLWFEGIGWNTPVRDIGWSYVILAACVILVAYFVYQLIKGER